MTNDPLGNPWPPPVIGSGVDEAPSAPAGGPAPTGARRALRWWPEVAIVLVSLLTNLWNLSVNGWANTYYSAAVRSMTGSWTAFAYGAFDPGAWITVDKPPLALWIPAASARVFGFSSWSILVPAALAGTASVALLLVTVRRVWGRGAGLAAGIALATMPVLVAVSRSNNPDVYLVLALVAAAYAVERAVHTGKLRWLLLAGVAVGLGFLAKLLAAFVVLPALWLAYLVGAEVGIRRRLAHLALASLVVLGVGGVWVAAVDVVPLSNRPWVGGSTDGSALDLVLGYNGLSRVTGGQGPGGGGPAGAPGGGPGGFAGAGGIDEFGGEPGMGRLFNDGMGDQVMWFAPLAGTALVGGLVLAARRRLSRERLASLAMFGGWAVTSYVVFAYAGGIFHNYYVSLLAPAVAALLGVGTALVLEGGRLARWVAAAALVATALLQVRLLGRVDAYEWLRVVVPVVVGIAAAALVVLALWHGATRRVLGVVVGAGVATVLLAPAAWSLSSLGHAQSGTFPAARPTATGAGLPGLGAFGPQAGGQAPAAGQGGTGAFPGLPGGGTIPGGGAGQAPGFPGGGSGGLLPGGGAGLPGAPGAGQVPVLPGGALPGSGPGGLAGAGGPLSGGLDADALTWLRSQRDGERWIVAVQSSMQAGTAIIAGDSVMAMGGFSGSDPAMTPERLAALVRDGELRFVTAGGGAGPGGVGPGGGGPGGGGSSVSQVVTRACTAVDASAWGGSGSSGIYDCRGAAGAILAAAGT